MSYRVEEVVLNKKKVFRVIEKDTNLELFETTSNRDARRVCRSLNLGSGFAGYTPSFFATKFPRIV